MNVCDFSDSDEIQVLQKRLQETTNRMSLLTEHVGKAKQIREFSGDRRKRALSKAMVTFLDQGETATAADAKARASFTYGEELQSQEKTLAIAETTLAEWDALHCSFEATRSLLSAQKEMARMQ